MGSIVFFESASCRALIMKHSHGCYPKKQAHVWFQTSVSAAVYLKVIHSAV